MPELPEVETSCRGIRPHIVGKQFKTIIVRQAQLRWPVPEKLSELLTGQTLLSVTRRGKYLLLTTAKGCLILHLGMSGNLRITSPQQVAGKHDHIDFMFADDTVLRLNDQRKFGAVLWTDQPETHPLLAILGPEPLTDQFNGAYLSQRASGRRLAIKSLIMDSHIVVGVGNIYASEALFLAGIHPERAAGEIDLADYERLSNAIKTVLEKAIIQGGTTLRDFTNADGKPGYFKQALQVYGRRDQACVCCSSPIQHLKIGQRASYFCPVCQH